MKNTKYPSTGEEINNIECLYNGILILILISLKKERITDIYNMNELQIHVPSEKSQTQRPHTTLFYLYDGLKRQGTETETNQWLSDLRAREEVHTEKLFRVIELFSIALMVKPLDAFVKTHRGGGVKMAEE